MRHSHDDDPQHPCTRKNCRYDYHDVHCDESTVFCLETETVDAITLEYGCLRCGAKL